MFGERLPISVHPLFWLMAGLIGWLNSAEMVATVLWMTVIFVSVLVHEMGHALTALAFGQNAAIELVALGGVTRRWGGKTSLWQEFLIVLNGPMAGLFLFAVSQYLLGMIDTNRLLLTYWLTAAVYVNLFWTLVNLLPIQPLDGGKLFSIVLEAIFGFRGVKIALFLSIVLALLLAFGCFAIGAFLPGALFLVFAFESYRTWKATLPMTETDNDSALQSELHEAETLLEQGRLEEAIHLLKDVQTVGGRGVLSLAATELMAGTLIEQGKFDEVYNLLNPIQSQLTSAGMMALHAAAYHLGHWRQAADLGNKVYQIEPNMDVAILNARCHARLGEIEPTKGWIQCAQSEGLADVELLTQDADFDRVREQL